MNEGFKSTKQYDESEKVRLRQNYETFDKIRRDADVRTLTGSSWYKVEFPELIGKVDFGKAFQYLSTHFDENKRQFTNQIFHVVRAQLLFQLKLVTLESKLDKHAGTLDVPEDALASLESAYNALSKLKGRYNRKAKQAQNKADLHDRLDARDAMENEKKDGIKSFLKAHAEATRAKETPWPIDADLLTEKPKATATSQPEHSNTNGSVPPENDAQTTSSEGDSEPAGADTVTGNSGDAANSETLATPEEPFVYDPEMLKTKEGISRVRQEIENMVTDVIKRRNDIGKKGLRYHIQDAPSDFKLFFRRHRALLGALDDIETRGEGGTISVDQNELDDFSVNFELLGEYQRNIENFEASEQKRDPEEFTEMHAQMLKTAEGRAQVFREMVHMYNTVRNKRDRLSFEGRKNMGNEEFDGYSAFYRRYMMLRKKLRTFSNQDVVMSEVEEGDADAKPKPVAYPVRTEIDPTEANDFVRGFGFLKDYYTRTQAFGESEAQTQNEAKSEDETTPQPDATVEPAPEPIAPEPTPEPEPQPDPDPVVDPVPPEPQQDPVSPAPEKNKFSVREEMRAGFSDFTAKKRAFMDAYETYLKGGAAARGELRSRIKRFELSPELEALETAFKEARMKYAETLDVVLKNNAVDEKVIRAMESKHLLLRQIDVRTELEKKYALESKGEQIFNKITNSLRKHPTLFKVLGAGVALGTGAIVGYLTTQVIRSVAGNSALGTLGVGAVTGGTVLGAAGGAWAGNVFADSRINKRRNAFEASYKNASSVFSTKTIDAREKQILEEQRELQKAIKDKKVIVTAGTIGGGIAGGVLAGNLDVDGLVENIPDFELPIDPRLDIEVNPNTEPPVRLETEIPYDPRLDIEVSPNTELPVQPDFELPIDPRLDIEVNPNTEPPVRLETEIPYDPRLDIEVNSNDEGETLYDTNLDDDDIIQNVPSNEEVIEEFDEDEQEQDIETPELLFTFEPGDKIDTVSEALFEEWKANSDLVENDLTKKEFLAEMYTAIAEIEKNPSLNAELMKEMGITSGDIDKVQVGQTINLQPFFEYLNTKN